MRWLFSFFLFFLYSHACLGLNVGLKVSAGKDWKNWGDYILGDDLAKGFENIGNTVIPSYIDSVNEPDINLDIDVYMKGFIPFNPNKNNSTINVLYLYYPIETSNTKKYKNINNIKEKSWYSLQTELWNFDIIGVASLKYQEELAHLGIKTIFTPQITNINKFFYEYDADKAHDILFVGRPGYERISAKWAIESGFDVALYGNGWQDKAPIKYFKGDYIDNNELHKFYSSAKIVLNDTRNDMKQAGFISNRVFDVTASGGFLISDYMEEIEHFYGDSIPMFKTKEELKGLIDYYLEHENERKEKARKAQEITLKNFTNEVVAKRIVEEAYKSTKIDYDKYIVKFPFGNNTYSIGDYWLGTDLVKGIRNNKKEVKEYFYNNGFNKDYFYQNAGNLLYLQFKYNHIEDDKDKNKIMYLYFPTLIPEKGKFNNDEYKIEHNTHVSLNNDLEYFDAIATPAKAVYEELKNKGYNAEFITQFTNSDKFNRKYDEKLKTDLLFVGSVWYERESVKYAIELGYDVDVYGLNWENKIDNKYIKGRFIDNNDLPKYYSSAKIVLSDHAEDLENMGLVINRLYDVSATGTLVISEYSPYIEEIFGDAIPMFKTKEELKDLIDYYLEHENEREKKALEAQAITLKNHTNSIIAKKIIDIFDNIRKDKQ